MFARAYMFLNRTLFISYSVFTCSGEVLSVLPMYDDWQPGQLNL